MLAFRSAFSTLTLSALMMCSAVQAAYPITVIDDRPTTTTLNSAPERVAAISIFGADLVSYLASTGKSKANVVALSTRNHATPAYLAPYLSKVEDLGATHETSLERLTAAKPDLTLGIRLYTQTVAHKIEEISPFLAFDLNSWQDSDSAIRVASTALDQPASGEQLNRDFRRQVAQLAARAPGGQRALFLWIWADTPMAYYSDGHLTTELMAALHAENLMGADPDGRKAHVLPMEQLYQLNPDVVLLFQGDSSPLPFHPVWPQLNAWKQNRIWRVSDQYVEPHGPMARELVLKEMAHLLYPDHFEAPAGLPAAARARPADWRRTE
ncbi:MAG: ABC transporter substrate-binding protein [Marinobacterium sp.]|nr:ABC transporter substrate-binding protein [Marinobacterium sp.]